MKPILRACLNKSAHRLFGRRCIVVATLFFIVTGLPAKDVEIVAPENFKVAELKRPIPIPPRKLAEVKEIAGDFKAPDKQRPFHVILAAGKKDHGVDEHDYPFFQKRYKTLLGFGKNVTVDTSWTWPTDEQYAKADVVVFNCMMHGLNPNETKRLNDFLTKGGGAVYLHIGIQSHKFQKEQSPNVGLVWSGRCRWRHGALDLDFTGTEHPITKGFTKVHFHDESYWELKGDPKGITVLATSLETSKRGEPKTPQPQIWTKDVGKGRVVGNILGHYSWTYDDPMFRILLFRSMGWVARDDLKRFDDLILLGARVE